MPDLTPGTYKITSCVEGNPLVGVSDTKPVSQTDHLNGTVTAVWQLFFPIQNARLTSLATVGSRERARVLLSAQCKGMFLNWDKQRSSLQSMRMSGTPEDICFVRCVRVPLTSS